MSEIGPASAPAEGPAARYGEPADSGGGHFGPYPGIDVPVPSPSPLAPDPAPAPPASRIDVRDTYIKDVPEEVRHTFIVYHDGATGNEYATRGGHTRGKGVCPGVGLYSWQPYCDPSGCSFCPYNDRSYSAIGVGPVNEFYDARHIDWPPLSSRTLLKGPAADTKTSCFVAEADRISMKCVPYSPCGPNSNSVTYTLLENCGVDAWEPGLALHPGWGMLL